MKNLLLILLSFPIFFSSCSNEVKITNKNLNCKNHNWKNDGYCDVISVFNHREYYKGQKIKCILYYKNKPFSGTIKWRKVDKNTYHTLYDYNCQYVDGKRNGIDTYESWFNNFPTTVETTIWNENIKGKYSKVPFRF